MTGNNVHNAAHRGGNWGAGLGGIAIAMAVLEHRQAAKLITEAYTTCACETLVEVAVFTWRLPDASLFVVAGYSAFLIGSAWAVLALGLRAIEAILRFLSRRPLARAETRHTTGETAHNSDVSS